MLVNIILMLTYMVITNIPKDYSGIFVMSKYVAYHQKNKNVLLMMSNRYGQEW